MGYPLTQSCYASKHSSNWRTFFDKSGEVTECVDYTGALIASVGHTVASACRLNGKEVPEAATKTTDAGNQARSLGGIFRSFTAIGSLLSLGWYYTTTKEGEIKRRHPLSIATSISLISARILSLVSKLHQFAVVDLRHHLSRIGHAITGLFTAVVVVGLVDTLRGFFDKENTEVGGLELVQSVTYAVMHPFECGVGMSSTCSPVLGIVGGVISAVGALVIIGTTICKSGGFVAKEA